jgi:hypothetical protein
MAILIHHQNIMGSVVHPHKDSRRTSAVRRGMVRSDAATKADVAAEVDTALGANYGAPYSHIPLNSIRLTQVGHQWYEYEAEFRETASSGLNISSVGMVRMDCPFKVGVPQTWVHPSEYPQMGSLEYFELKVRWVNPLVNLTASSLISILNDTAIGTVNTGTTSLSGVSFNAGTLRYDGFDVNYTGSGFSGKASSVAYNYTARRLSLPSDPTSSPLYIQSGSGVSPWKAGGYVRKTTSALVDGRRYFWDPVWVDPVFASSLGNQG